MTVATSEDLRKWGALLVEAEACAANPRRSAKPLLKAATGVFQAHWPSVEPLHVQLFFTLMKFSTTFAACDRDHRAQNADQLAVYARNARAIMGESAPPPLAAARSEEALPPAPLPVRAPTPRLDIDG